MLNIKNINEFYYLWKIWLLIDKKDLINEYVILNKKDSSGKELIIINK